MVRINLSELIKAMELLKKESLSDIVSIKEDGAMLKISTSDKNHKDLMVELSDTKYPMKPKLTRTEDF